MINQVKIIKDCYHKTSEGILGSKREKQKICHEFMHRNCNGLKFLIFKSPQTDCQTAGLVSLA